MYPPIYDYGYQQASYESLFSPMHHTSHSYTALYDWFSSLIYLIRVMYLSTNYDYDPLQAI